ncbi:MAG: NAD(+)/NADH kinase [Eggerthellaceae bacterium]|nr:NAD(+)/NADH kinase [Eggerthellaceae bacterium]
MKLLIINNLSSGYGEGAIYDFIRSFAAAGDEVSLRVVDEHSSFADMLRDARDFDAVVASGGDGTVASVCYQLRGSGIPVLPFPAGTANLLALNLWSPSEPHALARLIRQGKQLDFDMGEIQVGEQSHGFTIMAGCGYDAVIMNDAQSSKRLLGPMAYFKAAFSNPTPPKSHFNITIDGKSIEKDGVGIILINFSKIQFDISIATKNLPRDGKFDLLVLTSQTAWDLLPTVVGAAIDHSGTPLEKSDAVEFYQGSTIEIDANPPMNLQFDGETINTTTPFKAQILPKAARFIVSDQGYEEFA